VFVKDIELAIVPGNVPGIFRVEVIRSPAGEATAAVALDVDALLARRGQLQQAVLASAVASRALLTETERPVREVGLALFSALLGSDEVAGRYRASAALSDQQDQGLRIVLRIDDPALAGLPWEAMYDEATGAYVCRRNHLVRNLPVASVAAPLTVRPPLRILGVVSSPRGLAVLDVEREQEQLARALARPRGEGLVDVHWAPEATWASLHELLLADMWHVVHFIGHGDFDAERDEGLLALVGEGGRTEWVEADRLVDLFRQARPMPRLIVLNSCSGAATGAQDLFAGTAASLVRGRVTAVVAMQYAISDPAAAAFARGFYAAIARGLGVDDAVSSGRVAILGTRARTLEWVTPVIYLRGHDSRLFVVPPRPSSIDEFPQGSTQSRSALSASNPETEDNRQATAHVTDQQSRPWEPLRQRVERRVAEAEFRTDAVRWQVTELERLIHDRSRTLTSYRRRVEDVFITQGPDAFVAALQRALVTSVYPDGLHTSCRALYRPEARELMIEYELPRPDIVPAIAEYGYVVANDVMHAQPRNEAEIKELYRELIARVTLRALAETFDVSPVAVVRQILFSGYVPATNSTTERPTRPCLISLRVTRDVFAGISLDKPELDPIDCVRKYLRATVSPHPYDLEPVRPMVEFDLSRLRPVEMDLLSTLGDRPDLLALKPMEFEHLIRQLFEAIGLKSWVTQTSRDGGIDGVAVNEDPIVGGLCIIQAKQFSKTIPLATVRALAAVVDDKRAAKGILVTTSWVGKASRDFAIRNGRIEIIEGRHLKSLLKEHLGLDVRISLPTLRSKPE
jgi:restriction system protein